jgi:hypothetical protein
VKDLLGGLTGIHKFNVRAYAQTVGDLACSQRGPFDERLKTPLRKLFQQ